LIEAEVLEAPQVRYTQDNQTPVAEMVARFDGLRPEDPPGQVKVVGWGNLALDLQNRVQVGQRCLSPSSPVASTGRKAGGKPDPAPAPPTRETAAQSAAPVWNTSPLVPDDLGEGDDEIPF